MRPKIKTVNVNAKFDENETINRLKLRLSTPKRTPPSKVMKALLIICDFERRFICGGRNKKQIISMLGASKLLSRTLFPQPRLKGVSLLQALLPASVARSYSGFASDSYDIHPNGRRAPKVSEVGGEDDDEEELERLMKEGEEDEHEEEEEEGLEEEEEIFTSAMKDPAANIFSDSESDMSDEEGGEEVEEWAEGDKDGLAGGSEDGEEDIFPDPADFTDPEEEDNEEKGSDGDDMYSDDDDPENPIRLRDEEMNERWEEVQERTASFATADEDIYYTDVPDYLFDPFNRTQVMKPPLEYTAEEAKLAREMNAYVLAQMKEPGAERHGTLDKWDARLLNKMLGMENPALEDTIYDEAVLQKQLGRMSEEQLVTATLLLDPHLDNMTGFDAEQRVSIMDPILAADEDRSGHKWREVVREIAEEEGVEAELTDSDADEKLLENKVYKDPRFDCDKLEDAPKMKLLNFPEVADGEHLIFHEDETDDEFQDAPIVTYSDSMMFQSGGKMPILKDESKDQIYSLHKSDPEIYSVARLSQLYGLRQGRVTAILKSKALQEQMVEKHGPGILHPNLAQCMEEYLGAVSNFNESPERLYAEAIELNQHAPSVPHYTLMDGAADQRQAAKALWKGGKARRHYYLAPEDIPRTPTPNVPPPVVLDPGLTAALPRNKVRIMYANWNPDIPPIEEFAVIREVDGTVRTPTYEERLRYLHLPMHNLLPDRFRRVENAKRVDSPLFPPSEDNAPPTYDTVKLEWGDTESVLSMTEMMAKTDKMTLDEAFSRIIHGAHGDDNLHATEVAASAIADGGYEIDRDHESFIEDFMTNEPSEDELQREVYGSSAAADQFGPDDLSEIDSTKHKDKWVNFGDYLRKQQSEDTSPSGDTRRRGPPTLPSWLRQA